MATTPLVIERSYNASAEAVWQALTDKKKMKQWYFDVSDFQPTVGFEFTFEGGSKEKKYTHLCKVTEAIPGKKLSYTWKYKGYPGESHLTFELFPEGDKTRVKLTHSGLESFPTEKDFALESFTTGWTSLLGKNLSGFLEKAPQN